MISSSLQPPQLSLLHSAHPISTKFTLVSSKPCAVPVPRLSTFLNVSIYLSICNIPFYYKRSSTEPYQADNFLYADVCGCMLTYGAYVVQRSRTSGTTFFISSTTGYASSWPSGLSVGYTRSLRPHTLVA
jgi:hypothetical protein